jgi:hypothetical protein
VIGQGAPDAPDWGLDLDALLDFIAHTQPPGCRLI